MTQESPDIDEEKAVALHRRFLDKYPNLAQQDSSGQADRILHCRYIVEMDVYLINMRLRMSSKVEDLSFFVSYDGTIKDANEIEERCQKYLEDSLYLLTDALMKRTGESIRELIQGESHNDPVGTIRKLEKCLYTGLPFTPGSTDILLAPTVRHTIFTSQIAAMQKPYGAPIVCRIPHTRWPKNMADNMRYSFTHSLIHYSRQSDPDANF